MDDQPAPDPAEPTAPPRIWLGVLLGLLGGLVIGSAADTPSAASLLLGALTGAVVQLARKVQLLATAVTGLQQQTTAAVNRAATVAQPTPAAPTSPPITAVAPPNNSTRREASPQPQTPTPTPTPTTVPPVATSSATPTNRHTPQPANDWAQRAKKALFTYFTGGNLIVRVGALILLLGVVFILKYAVDNALLPIELRLAGLTVAALALLVLGWRLRNGRRAQALVIQGAGLGMLFLTTYASVAFYGLIPSTPGLGVMVCLTALAALLAVLQNSQAMAVLGLVAGFAAPIALSTGSGNYIGLFSYYALLNFGMLGIAWHKAWRGLKVAGMLFTFIVANAWAALDFNESNAWLPVQLFAALFFFQYLIISVLFALRQPPKLKGLVDGSLTFGMAVMASGLQFFVAERFEWGHVFSAIALSAIYLSLGFGLLRFGSASVRANTRLLSEAFLGLGVSFATLAIPLAFDAKITAAAWAAEGAGLLWIGLRQQRLLPRLAGIALQLLAMTLVLLAFFWDLFDHGDIALGLLISAAVLTVAATFSAYQLHKAAAHVEKRKAWYTVTGHILCVLAGLWWLICLAGMIYIYLPDHWAVGHWQFPILLAAFSVTAISLELLGRRLQWSTASSYALLLLPIGYLCLFNVDESQFAHIPGWLLLLASHWWRLYRQDQANNKHCVVAPELLQLWHAGGLWLGLALLTQAIHFGLTSTYLAEALGQPLGHPIGRDWQPLALATLLLLTTLLLHNRFSQHWWPLRTHANAYRQLGLMPPAILLMGALLMLLARSPATAPLPYVPVLNPFDLACLITFACLMLIWQRNSQTTLNKWQLPTWLGRAVAAGIGFVLLNGLLLHVLSHFAGIRYAWQPLFDSQLVQMSLSLLWSVLAVGSMLIASRRGWRVIWFGAAGLLGVVVLKLFLVELANSGTLAQIGSFVGVGLLLLLVGYSSPLPAKTTAARTPPAPGWDQDDDQDWQRSNNV